MASSFSIQIPTIVHLIQKLKPQSVLDIGKGFGKYGFLIHEYAGIDNQKKIDPALTIAQQSGIKVDAIEVDEDLLLPHLEQIYSEVFVGDVFDIYKKLKSYDLILMIDVIEHLVKEKALDLLQFFLKRNAIILIATPQHFFKQELYESEFEHHISHWTLGDFKRYGNVQYQYFDGGAVYLLSNDKIEIRGFGNTLIKKLRRIARSIKNEL